MSLAIRPAAPADYPAYARLLPELGVDDPTPSRERWIAELMPTTLIAEDRGTVVGYLYHQVFGPVAYVRNVVSDPSHRRRGVGRALMQEARLIFRAHGATEWCLNVKPDNVAARALYDSLGLRLAFESKAIRIDWSRVFAWPSAETKVEVRGVQPNEDDALERARGLLSGQLATARALADRIILGLWEDGRPAGVLVFNPHYPGCYPFRVAEPRFLSPFLRAVYPHRLPEHTWVQVVIEDQPEIADALLERGGALRLEILNLRGTI